MLYPWTKDERNKKEIKKVKKEKRKKKRAGERKHPIRDQRRGRSGLSVWFRAPRNGLWFSFWRILRIAVIYSCYTMGLTALVDKVSSSGLYVSTFRTRSSDRVPDSFHDGPPPLRVSNLSHGPCHACPTGVSRSGRVGAGPPPRGSIFLP